MVSFQHVQQVSWKSIYFCMRKFQTDETKIRLNVELPGPYKTVSWFNSEM